VPWQHGIIIMLMISCCSHAPMINNLCRGICAAQVVACAWHAKHAHQS